jgi:non-ribosomal peptide synthetase component F
LTSTSLLVCAFSCVLAKWSQHKRFTLNLTTFSRLPFHPEIDNVIGDFTSLTLLEVALRQQPFTDNAHAIQKQLVQDLDNRYFNGIEVIRALSRRNGNTVEALMPVVFTSTLSFNMDDAGTREAVFREVYGASQTSQVWLDHQVFEIQGALQYNWAVVEDIFPPGVIDAMFGAYHLLLETLAAGDSLWSATDVVRLPQPQRLVGERAPVRGAGSPAHALRAMEGKARVSPEAVAIIQGALEITYGQLTDASERIAHWLKDNQVAPGQVVGLWMKKDWELIAAIFGVLKCGASYLPLDISWPQPHCAALLEKGGAAWVLTQEDAGPGSWAIPALRVRDSHCQEIHSRPPLPPVPARQVACLLFDKASPAAERGAVIEHGKLAGIMEAVVEHHQVTQSDCAVWLAPVTSFASFFEVFGMLGAGGSVLIPGPAAGEWLTPDKASRITIANAGPAALEAFLDAIGPPNGRPVGLRLVLLGGVHVPAGLARRLEAQWPAARIVRVPDQADGAPWAMASAGDSAREEPLTVRTTPGHGVFILDEHLLDCPDHVVGTICIGAGMVREFVNDPEGGDGFILHADTGTSLYKTPYHGQFLGDGRIQLRHGREAPVARAGVAVDPGAGRQPVIGRNADEIEKLLLATWKQILACNEVDVTDNFFELGGNSMKVIQAVQLFNHQMEGALKASDLYNYPTVEQIVDMIAVKRCGEDLKKDTIQEYQL